jgi:dTDP-4-dehydrorhamnose reductase
MTRMGIIGANGQVAAELCLILRNHPGVEVVPICRNVGGSAFLRSQGVPCRHGLVTDPQQAGPLLGDCDVVVNAAVAAGTPQQIKRTERLLIHNSLTYSPTGSPLIYFSTQNVHGDPRPGARIHWLDAYGRAKLRSESFVRKAARTRKRDFYILRLGHVCGELQNITALIRQRLRSGPVSLPERDRVSNTVYTATIVDAILKIAAGCERPGTYDLMNWPEWMWSRVYEYEAARCNCELHIERVPEFHHSVRAGAWLKRATRRVVRAAATARGAKELALRTMAHMPGAYDSRAQATWYRLRAQAEIQALLQRPIIHESCFWRPLGRVFLHSLGKTADLLNEPCFRIPAGNPLRAWPPDLPLHSITSRSTARDQANQSLRASVTRANAVQR